MHQACSHGCLHDVAGILQSSAILYKNMTSIRYITFPEGSDKEDARSFLVKIFPESLNITFLRGLEINKKHIL